MKTLQGKLPLFFSFLFFFVAYLHLFITLFGSPSPTLVVLLNVSKLWGEGSVNLSYTTHLNIVASNCYNQP